MKEKKAIQNTVFTILVFLLCFILYGTRSFAGTTELNDHDGGSLSDPGTVYIIKGDETRDNTTNYFDVPENTGTQDQPLTIILDGVNVTQRDKSPEHSFIHIEKGSYVVIRLKNENFVEAWSHQETLSSNDGMAGIHVTNDSTVVITSDEGDGSTSGTLEVYGGGGKYGGAGIGARYNKKMGTVIIAGGTIEAHGGYGGAGIGSGRNDTDGYEGDVQITGGKVTAYGGYGGAGIGSGRDGKAYSIKISGGDVHAEGGSYGAGIGAGDSVSAGDGGSIVDLSITGGKIFAWGGIGAAGIGCSEGGEIQGSLSISGNYEIIAKGGSYGAGIGGGDSHDFGKPVNISGSGTIEAYGGRQGAGIGGGNDAGSGEISIIGDTNGRYGERGEAPDGSRGLEITAVAGLCDQVETNCYDNDAAAIGSGKAECGDVTIKNAVLRLCSGGQAADIGGGGYHTNPSGTVKNITIDNCEIISTSRHKVAPGIGSGYGGSVNNISISNTKYSGGGIGGAPMDVPYTDLNDVKTIIIDNSDIKAVWDEETPGQFTGGFTPSTGPQEHGAAGIGSGQYGSMGSITITDSKIVAQGFGSGSGIGGGGAGGNGFSSLDLTKWSVGDTGTIEISGSDVDAHSGKADFDEHSPITYWDGHVWIRIENPKMFGGGAGIGGGSASDTEKVWIHDCGTISAIGCGAGIGTGEGTGNISKGAVDYIWLENIEKLYAEGGNNCAGIGTGGSEGGVNQFDAEAGALKQIYISNCEDLEAHGGEWAAGIGLGCRSPDYYHIDATEKGDWPMAIIDSNVKAYGGGAGAGIGGGFEDYSNNNGGENPRLLIKGKTTVEAYGGEEVAYEDDKGVHGGGAGIGGGCCGAGSVIQIEIDEDYSCAAKGTFEHPEASKYYVKAVGNGGGAGIGSGGKTWDEGFADFESADTDSVIIKKGAIFAKGSDSKAVDGHAYDHFHMGAGAGIGGASFGSTIRYLYISGGYIWAEAGSPYNTRDDADDIGAGGIPSERQTITESDRKNGTLEIKDGTVLAETIGTFTTERKISGGSVSAVVKNATGVVDIDGEKVYKTTAKLPKGIKNEKIDSFSTSRNYGGKHIYADNKGKVYLYLYPKGDEQDHKQWADIEVNTDDAGKNNWHYTGYTNTEHTGILKIDGKKIPFSAPDEIRWNDDFTLSLQDGADDEDHVPAGTVWTDLAVSGSASLKEMVSDTSPGMSVKLHADSIGEFEVSAEAPYTPDEELYWASTAYYKGTVKKAVAEVTFTENPTKIYDAASVSEPSVDTESSGEVTYAWYRSDGTQLSGAPVDAGEYYVTATVAATTVYEEASARLDFSIIPAPTTVVLKSAEMLDDPECRVTAEVFGLYPQTNEHYGNVQFTVYDENGDPVGVWNEKKIKVYKADGQEIYTASADFTAPAGTYRIKAQYMPDVAPNFAASEPVEREYDKNLAPRNITVDSDTVSKSYGDAEFSLNASASASSSDEKWTYTIIHDSFSGFKLNGEAASAAVSVDTDGRVSVLHAGSAVIEIKVHDKTSTYQDATAYVTVNVSRKALTVSSYAYRGADESGNRVTRDVYGGLGDLSYGLEYDGLKSGDTAADFTHGYGTLSAADVPVTTDASDEPYPVKIVKNGVDLTVNGESYSNVFVSRDYDISFSEGRLTVEKRSINIQADPACGTYGGKEPEYSWSIASDQPANGGPAKWDSKMTIFDTDPEIVRKGRASGDYKALNAGSYDDCLDAADRWSSGNYSPVFLKGDLTIDPADISDDSRFTFDAENTEYNGRAQAQEFTVKDGAFDDPVTLTEGSDYEVTYPDSSMMTDAGTVTAMLTGKEGSNYTGTAEASYRITEKTVTIETRSAEKVYDGTPLTAGGSINGLVNGETAELVMTGSQTEVGVSTNTGEVKWNGSAKASNYKLRSKLGKLTVTAPDTRYYCVSGSGAKWKHGSSKSLKFTFKRNWHDDETYSRFTGLLFDGKEVPADYYDTEPGSVKITLSPKYLEKQKNGKHKLTAVFDDGKSDDVSVSVRGKNKDTNEEDDDNDNGDDNGGGLNDVNNGGTNGAGAGTGDETGIVMWLLVMMAASAGLALTAILRKLVRNR